MAKSDKIERRAVVEQIRSQQKRADQRQGAIIIGVCIVIGVLIIGAASYKPVKDWWDEREYAGKSLSEIGSPASACDPITTKKATGTQQHVDPGTPVAYTDAPPAFGEHENVPDSIERKFYGKSDRPRVEMLVHNLEHGYTILWYDETVADDREQMIQLRAMADKLQGTDNWRLKFKAVPWQKEDGKAFPSGKHVAITHWAAESKEKDAKPDEQVGVWQYCSAPSGEAVDAFMFKYDYTNSPEPRAG